MVFIADQQRCLQAVQTLQPLLGLLQQSAVAVSSERPVLLG